MASITLNDALGDYYMKRLTRLADNTQRHHEGELERMRTWVTKQTQPDVYLTDVDDTIMSRYFNTIRPPRVAESTFNNYRQYDIAFFKYCTGEGLIRRNPMRHVDPLTVPRRVRLQLSSEELYGLLDTASPRDRVALAIGMNTALRAQDMAALTIGSVNFTNNSLAAYIHKTKTEEILQLTSDLRTELLDWMHVYAQTLGITFDALPNNYILVPPMRGQRVKGDEYKARIEPLKRFSHPERIVQAALEAQGHETKGEGFHTLRRSLGRIMFEISAAKGDATAIRTAQALLGHKNQATTEIYLGITVDKRRRDEIMSGQSLLGQGMKLDQEKVAQRDERYGGVSAVA